MLILLCTPLLSHKFAALGEEEQRFHSPINGYSVVIPQGWSQIPQELVRQIYGARLSENKLDINIEAMFGRDFTDTFINYPYIAIKADKYSKLGINRPLTKSEVKKVFEKLTDGIMTTDKKIQLLKKLLEKASDVKNESSDDSDFKIWKNLVERTLIKVFGDKSFEVLEFKKLSFFYNPILFYLEDDHTAEQIASSR